MKKMLSVTGLLSAALLIPSVGGLAADDHRFGPDAARNDLKEFTVAEGLEVSLFASEPMVVNPANMDIDARGRVWVTEGANYRVSKRMHQKWGELRPGGDRINILEDTNGDGAADKQTTFYQDPSVNTALGVCVLGNRVIVSSSPYVFVLTDTNGDDMADKREILFEDAGQGDHDHDLHTFTFGPDGKLYFNFGNDSPQLRRPLNGTNVPLNGPIPAHETQPVVDLAGNQVNNHGQPYRQGMVFRCKADGSEVETLGWNFRNNFEVCVDSFGTLWQSDNDDDGNKGVRINYVMEFGNYGYTDEMNGAGWVQKRTGWEEEVPLRHWHQNDPGVVPNLLLTGAGSPTGILFYEGKLLPQIFRNQIIHCDAGPRVVRAYLTTPDGAGYKAEIKDILTSSNMWFRPSDVCAAPDGSIYVADWNDAGVGGHAMADQKLETMTGRIYRVAPKGNKPNVPKFDFTKADDRVGALQSPNLATRFLAWTTLHGLQGPAEKDLLKLLISPDAHDRARALQLLARIKGNERKYVELALKDRDPDVRITALRIAREERLDLIPYVRMLVKDPSAQVRRDCAIALRHHVSPEAPRLWAQLAQQHDGKDRWYLEALGIGADKQWDKYFDAWLAAVGDNWNTPAGRDIVWRSRSKKTPALLVKVITDKNLTPRERDHYIRSMDFITGPEKEAALVELVTSAVPVK